jgi:RNA polymerase sigma-70 factor (ECF subfamily)
MTQGQAREDFAKRWLEVEPAVSAYVFAAISGFHDAEDVVQRIALELARRFDEYDPSRPFTGWALWVAKSRVIDFYRVEGRRRVVFSDDLLQKLAETIAQQADGRNQRREALEACLDGLPEKSRRMLELRYVDEKSADRVAQEIGSTSGSVRVLLTRVRAALADCIRRRLSKEQA